MTKWHEFMTRRYDTEAVMILKDQSLNYVHPKRTDSARMKRHKIQGTLERAKEERHKLGW